MIPTLRAADLQLRPLLAADAEQLVPLLRDPAVAEPYVLPRYPWSVATARAEIAAMPASFEASRRLDLGIVPVAEGRVVGEISLGFAPAHDRAEIGFWVGRPWWGRGYARASIGLLLDWAFAERRLHRVTARTLGDNQRAARLLDALGFRREGLLREHQYHWGRFRDVALWGLLASDAAANPSDAVSSSRRDKI